MKYNQNRKIMQVKDSTLLVGIDIAKKNHVARAQDWRGIELGKALNFSNTKDGLNQLMDWIIDLKANCGKEDIIVGVEPTGHYWLNLAEHLRNIGVKLVLVNPAHVKKSKELDDNSPTKNDLKDARVIAQLVKDGRYSEPNIPTGIYAEMRVAMTLRENMITEISRLKNKIHRWIDRYFPEFLTVFKSWEGKAAIATLKEFPTPEEITALTPEQIVKAWRKTVKRAVGLKRARKLLAAAKRSVGLTEGLTMAVKELSYLVGKYELETDKLEELESKVKEYLKVIPGAKQMHSIPGVGEITVAGFISEVGDVRNYQHPRQIQKLAGLNLKENSSGQHKGKTTITKRGRPKLRALLYRVMMPLVGKNDEFKRLHEYYTTRPDNPLKKKQSMIALACKLIRILFTLGRRRVNYDGKRLLNDITRINVQKTA